MTKLLFTLALFFGMLFSLFAQENTAILCTDGIDNDGDGLIDCEDEQCINLGNVNGCEICSGGINFVDVVLGAFGPNTSSSSQTLGLNDWSSENGGSHSLGQNGYVILGFLNNTLTNSGTNDVDVLVFEAFNNPEATFVSLRPVDVNTTNLITAAGVEDVDNDSYYEFGMIPGGVAGIDIDAFVPGIAPNVLLFDAIKILDANTTSTGQDGADLDAVCAVYYDVIPDCAGNFPPTLIIDNCGQCLSVNDPLFNQSCPDCAGIPNGPFVLDDCGVCNNPISPDFNATCTDCMGVVNGGAVLDACGVCRFPDDPNFNQSCLDCNGVVNGSAIIDECGDCFSENDPEFNQSCADCAGNPFGTAVIDECGVCLEMNDPNFNQSCADCAGITNGTSLVDECGECIEMNSPDFNQSCADCTGTVNGLSVIDSCGLCLLPNAPNFNQSCRDCAGDIFGTALIDSCGVCLPASDPSFNKSCLIQIFIPNAFSPDFDGVNDRFEIFKDDSSELTIAYYAVYDRWGNRLYFATNFDFSEIDKWWNGEVKPGIVAAGVYTYIIEVVSTNTLDTRLFSGDISVMK